MQGCVGVIGCDNVAVMFTPEKLAALSVLTATGVIAAMIRLRDTIIAATVVPGTAKEHIRLGWLKLRGMREYQGRHRVRP